MTRLPDLEAWAIFARVAYLGSFSRAAEELGLSKATISKAVGRLETNLATPLFHRTSRRLSLTESGRIALERAERILSEGEAVESELRAHSATPRGRVRMAAPMSFGIAHLAPALPDFYAAYPDVSIELNLSDQQVDLVSENFDLAVRLATLIDSSLIARRLCEMHILLVGTPAYFRAHGRPEHPKDLAAHRGLFYTYGRSQDAWRFLHKQQGEYSIRIESPLRVNNAEALTPSLMAGLGLALQPEFLVWRELQSGSLEVAMPEWTVPSIALHLVTPPSFIRPARVEVLLDFLAKRFAAGTAPWVVQTRKRN